MGGTAPMLVSVKFIVIVDIDMLFLVSVNWTSVVFNASKRAAYCPTEPAGWYPATYSHASLHPLSFPAAAKTHPPGCGESTIQCATAIVCCAFSIPTVAQSDVEKSACGVEPNKSMLTLALVSLQLSFV